MSRRLVDAIGDARAQAKIAIRVNRLAAGNFATASRCVRFVRGCDRLGTGLPFYYGMIGRVCVFFSVAATNENVRRH